MFSYSFANAIEIDISQKVCICGSFVDVATTSTYNENTGNLFVGGYTYSSNLNTIKGVLHEQRDPDVNYQTKTGFVAKFDPNLQLLSMTYISFDNANYSVADMIIADGTLYVLIQTDSSRVLHSGYQRNSGGLSDILILKMDLDLENVIANTYLGGQGGEYPKEIAYVDDKIVVVAMTYSDDIDGTTLQMDDPDPISSDFLIGTFNSDLTQSYNLGYLGGDGTDVLNKVSITSDYIILLGTTHSTAESFPNVVNNFYNMNVPFPESAFLVFVPINHGSAISFLFPGLPTSIYAYENGATFTDQEVLITGSGFSWFNVSSNAYQENPFPTSTSGIELDAIMKFSPSSESLFEIVTYIGGRQDDTYFDISVVNADIDDELVVIAGSSSSEDYPIINSSAKYEGLTEGVVTSFSNEFSEVEYSTMIPGPLQEFIYDMELVSIDNIYLVGSSEIQTDRSTTDIDGMVIHLEEGNIQSNTSATRFIDKIGIFLIILVISKFHQLKRNQIIIKFS